MVHKNLKFDLNKSPATFSCDDEFSKDNKVDDTALRLEFFGHRAVSRATSRPQNGCGLVLGLGPASSLNEHDLVLKLGVSQHSTSLKSDLKSFSNCQSSSVEFTNEFGLDHDGSTSKSSGGYMPSLILAPRIHVPPKKLTSFETEPSDGSSSELRIKHGGRKRLVLSPGPGPSDNHSLSCSSGVSSFTSWPGPGPGSAKRRQMIPPQVLVPSSMKSSSFLPFTRQSSSSTDNNSGQKSVGLVVPEERVHGGKPASYCSWFTES